MKKCKEILKFKGSKTPDSKKLINQGLQIIERLGIPVADKTDRQLEMMVMCFLAIGGINKSGGWLKVKTLEDGRTLSSRGIIEWINDNFSENISSGSYDDIRRKYLAHFILARLQSKQPTKGIWSSPISEQNFKILW